MEVVIIPVLEDNFAYLLYDKTTLEGMVIDGVEPVKVLGVVERFGVHVHCIASTHHHWDHSGGNIELSARLGGIPVLGGEGDDVPGVSRPLVHREKFHVGSLEVQVLQTPCHTKGHVSYFATDGSRRAVFTGDTLFVGKSVLIPSLNLVV